MPDATRFRVVTSKIKNSAFANYLLSEGFWKGEPITIEQGGNNRIFNSVKLKCQDGKVLFG